MSGRYQNRRRGHGGRGRGRGGSTPETSHTKKIVSDYLFRVVSIKQAWDYEIMAEFVAAMMLQRHCKIWSKQTQTSGSQHSRSVLI